MKNYKYHYVYRITNIITEMHYYGDRSCNCQPSEDLGVKYFSSFTNKLFKQDQQQNPQDYKYKIIKIFETCREDAKQLEVDLHKKFDVKNNPKFINRANQTSSGFNVTRESIKKGHQTRLLNNSYITGSLKAKKTWEKKTDEEMKELSNKFKVAFSNIDTKLRGKKTMFTKRNTILPNGKSILQSSIEKSTETMKNNGWYLTLSIQQSNLQNEIQIDGRTKAQHSREKQYKNQLEQIDENGLNGAQRATLKYHENLRNTIDEETGLTKAELRIKRQKDTIAKRGSMSGKNNSAYGFRWIYNNELRESKRVRENELTDYYTQGWLKGMKREFCKNKK